MEMILGDYTFLKIPQTKTQVSSNGNVPAVDMKTSSGKIPAATVGMSIDALLAIYFACRGTHAFRERNLPQRGRQYSD